MKDFIINIIIVFSILFCLFILITPFAVFVLDNIVEPKLVQKIESENGTVLIFKNFISYQKIKLNKPMEVKSNIKQDNRH